MYVLLRELHRVRRRAGLPRRTGAISLAVRHVDAGSCNACEHELTAASGPVTRRMAVPLRHAYDAMPSPRLVVALGDCALGCGVLADAAELAEPLEKLLPVDIRIPGCPPNPAAIAEGILEHLRQPR